MKEEKNNPQLKRDKKADQELEVEQILRKADEHVGEQLIIGTEGRLSTEKEIKHFALGEIPDAPQEKYQVYYHGIEKLLKEFLPKGKKSEPARKAIREEKNIFLTRGHKLNSKGRRLADSRQAYLTDMEEMMNLIANWAVNSRNYLDLYFEIKNRNKKLGYHQ